MSTNPEFSRCVDPASISGETLRGEATAEEREALTRRFDVPAVLALEYEADAAPWLGDGWRLSGVVRAKLNQTCVVTLEMIVTTVEEAFTRYFAPTARLEEARLRLNEDDAALLEPLGETIDLGEAAAETAALAIDPYPRAEGVAFKGALKGPPGVEPLTDEAARPFAGLAALTKRKGGDA